MRDVYDDQSDEMRRITIRTNVVETDDDIQSAGLADERCVWSDLCEEQKFARALVSSARRWRTILTTTIPSIHHS